MPDLRLILGSFLLLSLSIAIVYSQPTSVVPIQSTGAILYDVHRLRTSGTAIVDGSGKKVVLVGTQITWNEYSKGFFGIEDLRKMKSYGGNHTLCIEIHTLRFEQLMPQRNVIDESFFTDKLDKWVAWCEQIQVYCIINVQNFVWSDSFSVGMPVWMLDGHSYGLPPYDKMTNNKAYVDFLDINNTLHEDNRQSFIYLWSFVANRYKNNQYALFGIANEPLCEINLDKDQSRYLGITYSRFMEQVVDAIRSVGAQQLVFIDRPYVTGQPQYFGNIQPVNRENIVWEDHLYVSPYWTPHTLIDWESTMNNQYIPRFIHDFQKPLYIGEYSPYPINITDWRNILKGQVNFLKNSEVSGYSWHAWGFLEGEYYDVESNYLDQADSDYILQTIYG